MNEKMIEIRKNIIALKEYFSINPNNLEILTKIKLLESEIKKLWRH